jgi:hypothetical protein
MSTPRPLASSSTAGELAQWVTEWSERYPFGYDDVLTPITRPPAKAFDLDELITIYRWKLGDQWKKVRIDELRAHHVALPTAIATATSAAFAAASDAAALAALIPIPGMKNSKLAAVRSTVLMVADPDRWSPSDKMANKSVVMLRDRLAPRTINPADPLHKLVVLLGQFRPVPDSKGGYPACAADWPTYMACCREISRITWLSLRTVDRALYEARGR